MRTWEVFPIGNTWAKRPESVTGCWTNKHLKSVPIRVVWSALYCSSRRHLWVGAGGRQHSRSRCSLPRLARFNQRFCAGAIKAGRALRPNPFLVSILTWWGVIWHYLPVNIPRGLGSLNAHQHLLSQHPKLPSVCCSLSLQSSKWKKLFFQDNFLTPRLTFANNSNMFCIWLFASFSS